MAKEIMDVVKKSAKDCNDIDAVIIIGIGETSKLFVSDGFSKRSDVVRMLGELTMAQHKFAKMLNLLDDRAD